MEHLPLVHSRIIQDEQRQSAASEGSLFLPHLSTISWQHREQTASWDTSPKKGG